jgi:aspartyl-tRNA synthetase
LQITAKKGVVDEKVLQTFDELKEEDVITVTGTVHHIASAPGGVEVEPKEIEVVSKVLERLPIATSGVIEPNLDVRLDNRVLDLRRPENAAVIKIQSKIVEGMTSFLRSKGFIQVFTPCLMGVAAEGGAEVFPVLYYNKTATLRQDPQLHRQLMIASGFEKLFDLGPSWRAEASHTPRHLSEHRTCAVEMAFIESEADIMKLEEDLVVSVLQTVAKECQDELKLLGKEIEIPTTPFPELRFPKIYDILLEFGKNIPFGADIDRESEIILAKYVKEKYKSDFFFENRFPSAVKPFYVMKVDEEPQWARSIDLVYKGLEQSSGGQREHRYEKLLKQVEEKGMHLEDVKWFVDVFKYGVPPHGGFSIGIERLTMKLLDLSNVREATPFPRSPERLVP